MISFSLYFSQIMATMLSSTVV